MARLYSEHEPEEARSKAKKRGCLLVGKAALKPLPTIKERLNKAALQTSPPRGKEQVHDCSIGTLLLQWDQFLITHEGPSRVMSGLSARDSVKTKSLSREHTGGCQGRDHLTVTRRDQQGATLAHAHQDARGR